MRGDPTNMRRIKQTLITIKEASLILGVCIQTLRKWDKIGKLKAKRHKDNNYRIYRFLEIERFIKKTDFKIKGEKHLKLIED